MSFLRKQESKSLDSVSHSTALRAGKHGMTQKRDTRISSEITDFCRTGQDLIVEVAGQSFAIFVTMGICYVSSPEKKDFFLSHFRLLFALNSRSASIWRPCKVQSDAELVNAVLNGNKETFAALVKRYERPVRAIALDALGDYHSAADVSQDAFLKAYEALSKLRKRNAFGPWLMRIAHRCALDSVRRRPRETALETNVAAAIENPNSQLDEGKQRLLAAVVRLPKAERQVVMLRYFSGQSVKDVAHVAGRSVGTVTKQLSRAQGRLRRILKEAE